MPPPNDLYLQNSPCLIGLKHKVIHKLIYRFLQNTGPLVFRRISFVSLKFIILEKFLEPFSRKS